MPVFSAKREFWSRFCLQPTKQRHDLFLMNKSLMQVDFKKGVACSSNILCKVCVQRPKLINSGRQCFGVLLSGHVASCTMQVHPT